MSNPALRELVGVLIKLEEFLQSVDLKALQASLDPPAVPQNVQKHHIHIANKAGRDCYQEYFDQRRSLGLPFDKGTPHRAQHRSVCAICGTVIEPGHDIMICRTKGA